MNPRDVGGFRAYTDAATPRIWERTALGFAIAALVWWPLDRFVLPGPERSVAAFAALRAVAIPVNLFFGLFLRRLPLVSRFPVPLIGAGVAAQAAWTGWCMAAAGDESGPWFSFLYVMPLLTVLLLAPLRTRVVATFAVGLACWGGYYAHPTASLAGMNARFTTSFLLFTTALSIAYGHALYALVRTNFDQREQLAERERAFAALNSELEDRVRAQTDALRQVALRQETLREADRLHLARELHDELGQELLAVRFAVALAQTRAAAGKEVGPALAEVESLLDRTRASTRRMLASLRPQALDTLGLVPALRQLAATTARRADLRCEVDAEPLPAGASPALIDALYRVTQECLTNASRHARATAVQVSLRARPDAVELVVQDDGIGPPAPSAPGGLGLLGIQERALQLRGRATWTAASPGTRVTVVLPLDAALPATEAS